MANDQQQQRKKQPVRLHIPRSKNPKKNLPPKQWLTVAETAAVFGKSKVTIYDWIKNDIIPSVKLIKGIYYLPRKWVEPIIDD